MIISKGKIQMDPVKVAGIAEWPTLHNKCELQSFLGFCNFYCCLIQGYVKTALPLHSLNGNAPLTWNDEQQEAFDKLQTLITTIPILSIPNPNNPFCLEANASAYAVSAILSQKQGNIWKPIAYMYKALSKTQQNCEVYDCKLLAIMLALEDF
jgi:hypothetical protein